MWGFYNERDRQLGKEIFKQMMNKASNYHKSGTKTLRGPDQFFLTDHVYPLVKSRSIIHDSYTCKQFKDSQPFPTKRVGGCYVAIQEWDGLCIKNNKFPDCPVDCRPGEQKNWTLC